jgi:hypothetical protein
MFSQEQTIARLDSELFDALRLERQRQQDPTRTSASESAS